MELYRRLRATLNQAAVVISETVGRVQPRDPLNFTDR